MRGKREGPVMKKKELRGVEKDRMYRRKRRWENMGVRGRRRVK